MAVEWEVIGRLLLATLLSGLVGMERERGERAAGLRTHAMVGLGSCLVMIISAHGFGSFEAAPGRFDPSRMAAQVVSGIGFLGAGAIIFQREVVRGLTTAASIWVVAAVGLAVGGGLYVLAGVTTITTLVVLAGLKPFERRFFSRHWDRRLSLAVDPELVRVDSILLQARQAGLEVRAVHLRSGDRDGRQHVDLVYRVGAANDVLDRVIEELRRLPGVTAVHYTPSPRGGQHSVSGEG